MKQILSLLFVLLACTGIARAEENEAIRNIYADMDAKFMSSNLNVFNYYSPDAVITATIRGGYYSLDTARSNMQQAIRKGIKVDIYQSTITGTRVIGVGRKNAICSIVVFSKDYVKTSFDDPNAPGKRASKEASFMTTRVFDTTGNKWVIISEHSSIIPNIENGTPQAE